MRATNVDLSKFRDMISGLDNNHQGDQVKSTFAIAKPDIFALSGIASDVQVKDIPSHLSPPNLLDFPL
jgi:hypothetical protein